MLVYIHFHLVEYKGNKKDESSFVATQKLLFLSVEQPLNNDKMIFRHLCSNKNNIVGTISKTFKRANLLPLSLGWKLPSLQTHLGSATAVGLHVG